MNRLTVHINDVNDITDKFNKGQNILNGLYLKTYELKINNCFLYFVLESTVFNHELYPRNKLFLKITDNYLNKYKNLILKIQSDIKETVNDYDTVFYGKSNYLTPRIIGGTVNDNKTVFTKIYKLINNNTVKINTDEVPKQFKGLFTIKIRSVANNTEGDNYLILEVIDILITEIIKNTVDNDKPLSYKYLNYKIE